MALPLRYNIRNVLVRWRSTVTTILGIALVVGVYVLMQAMAAGIERSSANTGSPDNLLIVRRGSTAESSSIVSREQLRTLLYSPEIARTTNDEPLISADVHVLLNLPRRDGGGEANVLLRGVSPRGRDLRGQVQLAEGRWFERGAGQDSSSDRQSEGVVASGVSCKAVFPEEVEVSAVVDAAQSEDVLGPVE